MQPGTTPRAERQRRTVREMAELRQEMLDFALDLFRREGPGAISIRGMTEHFGISPMTFYGYFPNKQALMVCLWDDSFRELLERLLAVSQGVRTPLKVLRGHLDAWLSHWEQNPELYRLIYMTGGDGENGAPLSLAFDPVHQQLRALGCERIAACGHPNEPSEDAIRLAHDLISVHAIGYLHASIGMQSRPLATDSRLRDLMIEETLLTTLRILERAPVKKVRIKAP